MNSLTNQEFLKAILNSFNRFIDSGTSRSTDKLKPLHGAIARDIAERLGTEYIVKSQGYGDDKEAKIDGRYVDKAVDITILKRSTLKPVAGIAVKFVMQNYSQNSNNYFENMLGETANIRAAKCPYFQLFIIPDKLPYYSNGGDFKHWEEFSDHNMAKYITLSSDNIKEFLHTPDKTLIYVIHVNPEMDDNIFYSKSDYLDFYMAHTPRLTLTTHNYHLPEGGSVILNNYEFFMDKVYHTIMAI